MNVNLPDDFVPVLAFHEISERDSPWCVSPDMFRSLLLWLSKEGRPVVTMGTLAELYMNGQAKSSRAVALTFDDGRSGVFRHALSTMDEFDVRATIYAVTEWTRGAKTPPEEQYSEIMTMAELRRLAGDGHEIGFHSSRHTCYQTLSGSELRADLSEGLRRLKEDLERDVVHFTYPFGHYDERIERIISEGDRFVTVALAIVASMAI